MRIHYNKTLEQNYEIVTRIAEDPPAWLAICLVRALHDWFGQSSRAYYRPGDTQLRLGYEIVSIPVQEIAENFGPLICKIDETWPVRIFGTSNDGELIELSFRQENSRLVVRQNGISGIWCEHLQDFYLYIQFPDPLAAECINQLLTAAVQNAAVVALDWRFADFLEQQELAQMDRTLSFFYISFDTESAQDDPEACLAGLTLAQKESLWRLFLEKQLQAPEFEWLRDALLRAGVPNWMEWQLALYDVLEQLGIQFVCEGKQFALMDRNGKRLYFSVDHSCAAEHVLMKILFPLNE